MDCPVGSNSRARSSGSRPARTRSTIWRRNSGEYGGCVLGIGSTSGESFRVSTNPGQSQTYAGPATRVALRPHDPHSGEEIGRYEVVKGYEYERGQFVTSTTEELKALDVESSRTVDLSTFVPRADIDPVYFSTPYFVYPDGRVAAEAYSVIAHALAEAGMAGIGTITLSRRERMVMVEPRGAGLMLITLRAADEVRSAEFEGLTDDADPEAIAIAEMIIKRRSGVFDPSTFRDRYQDASRELIDAKLKGRRIQPPAPRTVEPAPDLMAALKRSLAEITETAPKRRRKPTADRRQPSLLLPVAGNGKTPKQLRPHARRPSAAGRRKLGWSSSLTWGEVSHAEVFRPDRVDHSGFHREPGAQKQYARRSNRARRRCLLAAGT
jgi:DNA end-binding protein Ku